MSMSNLRWLLATALLLTGLPAAAYAQGGTITGQVVNQDTQAPLSGVQVFVTGTNRGTLTNQEGAAGEAAPLGYGSCVNGETTPAQA